MVKGKKYLFNISNLEKQIAFGISGSEKDLEDARHLWNIFKDNLNKQLILQKQKS